jgi:predicted extracellular nuclease
MIFMLATVASAILVVGCTTNTSTSGRSAKSSKGEAPLLGLETPYPGVVRGLVVANLAYAAESGFMRYAFVIQAPRLRADRKSETPDGVMVRIAHGRKLDYRGKPYYPAPGDEIILRGDITEESGAPILESAQLIRVVRKGVNLKAEAPVFEADPPADHAAARDYWRGHFGQRCRIPEGSVVQGYHVSRWNNISSSATLLRPDHKLLRRRDPLARRVYRDEHPLDDLQKRFDNRNGFLIHVSDAALRHAAGEPGTYIPPTHTFQSLKEDVIGVVAWDGYDFVIEALTPVSFNPGLDPATNKPRRSPASASHLTVATYNLENLYDRVDDLFDKKDFKIPSAKRVYNYVPLSQEDFADRLQCFAQQIIQDLRTPDILMIQEIEDQDIGTPKGKHLDYATANNRDGMPDVLQELALTIRAAGGPEYISVFDRTGADTRGITSAYLYRPDRLHLAEPGVADELLSGTPSISTTGSTLVAGMAFSNPRVINVHIPEHDIVFARAPQVAVFTPIAKELERNDPIFLINNHFRSRPDKYIERRQAQALHNADIANFIQKHHKDAAIIVAGDLNTFPRPYEPIPEAPADQLGALYDADLVNLYDAQVENHPTSAYSYVYRGQAQTIDHLFVSHALIKRLVQVIPLHINSDFAPHPAFKNRGCSDHDPQLAVFEFGKD